jgi:hypothetical protein
MNMKGNFTGLRFTFMGVTVERDLLAILELLGQFLLFYLVCTQGGGGSRGGRSDAVRDALNSTST